MHPPISRRRFIVITGASAALGLLAPGRRALARTEFVTWQGQAMGAAATLKLHHPDRSAAERLIGRVVGEVRRLEGIFSLYREDSAIASLNRTGLSIAPPPELVELLVACRRYYDLSTGAFDATVQPLWTLYRDHFSKPGANPDGPPRDAVEAALAKIGMDKVLVGPDRIAFAWRGMGLTLNGIAQGFVTDRVIELLRSEGVDHSLADLGESRAIGAPPDGGPWRVALQGAEAAQGVADGSLTLVDQAGATSGAYGFRVDAGGRFNHLFDTRNGTCAERYRSVTVVAPTATMADALSTALSLMAPEAAAALLRAAGGSEAHLTTKDGARPIVRS